MGKPRYWYRPGLYKFFIVIWLIFNTGIFQAIFKELPSLTENNGQSREEQVRTSRKAFHFVEVKIAAAREKVAKGGVYSPYDYFRDFGETELIQKNIDTFVLTSMAPLQAMAQDSLKKGFTYLDFEKARWNYKGNFFDQFSKRSEITKNRMKGIWIDFLFWLFGVYLKNMFPVFFMYLIWIKDSRGILETVIRFPHPLFFLWTLAAHPFYISKVFLKMLKREGREMLAESEYRRTKEQLFVFLSPAETERIKRFAASAMPVSVWRELLRESNIKPIHTLAIALLATFVFTMLPKPMEVETKPAERGSLAVSGIANHLARMDISIDENDRSPGVKYKKAAGGKDLIHERWNLSDMLPVRCAITRRQKISLEKIYQNIEHIPLPRLASLSQYLECQTN